ncbi:nuclease-related domain-containing protein [Streptomyces diacarni]|uniref:nuclease-related domain-containing protein n=1 Tax=Streptomyces diacarni TaxID=2800381 RepID=UPI0034079972
MLLWLVILGVAAWFAWDWWTRRHAPGAGASAAARARQLRTPLVRLADAVGISTQAGRLANRYEAGATGERRLAAHLADLTRDGYTVLADRRLPRGNANVDFLVITPTGAVWLPDAKRWSARWPLTVNAGRLMHGDHDVSGRLRGLRHETAAVSAALGVPVTPIVAMDGTPLLGPHGRPVSELAFRGVRIVPADALPNVLRAAARIPGQRPAVELVILAEHVLPPYTHTRPRPTRNG